MISLRRSEIAGEYRGINSYGQLILRVDVGKDDSWDIISDDLAFNSGTGILELDELSTALSLGLCCA